MKHLFTFLFLLVTSISLRAQIVFDGSPGTGAPPATLGGYTMTSVVDTRANGTTVSSVPSPLNGSIGVSPEQVIYTPRPAADASIPFTWGNGYTGRIYFNFNTTITLTLPADTKAFYFYASTSNGPGYTVTATTQNNSATSGPIPVRPQAIASNADAQYFGFYVTQSGVNIETITITGQAGSNGVTIGQFGIFQGQCSYITPTLTASNNGVITCTNRNLTLTAGGGSNYTFTGPGGLNQTGSSNTASISQDGTYTVSVPGANGCPSSSTMTTVSSNTTAPTVSLSSSGTLTCTNKTVTLTAGGADTYVFYGGATSTGPNTATVSQGGTYIVMGTSTANGCSSLTTTTVESNTTTPTATLSNNGPIADNNQTVTLTAGGGTSYAFSPGATPSGNNTATVTTPGVYSVTATGANGCTGVASTTVAGAQNPATICRNGTAVIRVVTTGAPVKYEWYKNTLNSPRLAEITNLQRGTATSSLTLTNQQVTANYYVRVTDQSGTAVVYGPFKVTVNMGCITALGRLAAEEVELKITLLGNPLIGEQLRATVSGAAGKALNVQLLDLSGKQLRSQQWQQAESEQRVDWNLGGQASGVYLLQAVTPADGSIPAQRHSLKVIKP